MKEALVVGAGLYGATAAWILAEKGYSVRVLERRDHVAGNCHTERTEGVTVHQYGPHIFNTNSLKVWNFARKFCAMRHYRHVVMGQTATDLMPLPISLFAMHRLFHNVNTPEDAKAAVAQNCISLTDQESVENWCLANIGAVLYETFVKNYTQRQWGRHPRDLPAAIIKRIPVRFEWSADYHSALYSGIPMQGYTDMVWRMLEHPGVKLEFGDFFDNRDAHMRRYDIIIYTGPVDRFFDYVHGRLPYRSLFFEHMHTGVPDAQGCAQINFLDAHSKHTRAVEHKHFLDEKTDNSIVTLERSFECGHDDEPFYPIPGEGRAQLLFYEEMQKEVPNVRFGGRLGSYRYLNMDAAMAAAMKLASSIA